jgi:GTP cyclohydrolase FolE2
MQAFDNPAFVEDVARGVALNLKDDNRVDSFYVDENINNHRAFARIGRPLL